MKKHSTTRYITLAIFILASIITGIGVNMQDLPLCDVIICILGLLATTYVVYFVTFFFLEKIHRDVILVKENYLVWVLLLVLAMPFVFTWIILLLGIPNMLLSSAASSNMVAAKDSQAISVLWSVIFHYVDTELTNVSANVGKIISMAIALSSIFLFNGLLVSTILNWTTSRYEKWDNGDIRYPLSSLPKNRFAVVIGSNEVAVTVIKELLQQPPKHEQRLDYLHKQENDYVILQTSAEVSEVREQLSAQLTDDELDRVICYNALRTSRKEIEQLYLPYATCIYILGESTIGLNAETGHDALNMSCLNLIARQLLVHKKSLGDKYEKKTCRVMFDYHTTYSVFQFSDVASEVRETMVFTPFNIYESWARKVMVENQASNHGYTIQYTPLDGYDGIRAEDDKYVHLVIIGMSKMGVAMAEQALYQAHYLNYAKRRTRITFIDSVADKKMAFFKGRHATLFELMRHRFVDGECGLDVPWTDPMLAADCPWKHLSDDGSNFIDTEVEFIKGDVESDIVRTYLRNVAADPASKLTLAVCLSRTHQAIAASLYLPIEIYESNQLQDIWIYQREVVDMVGNLTDESVAISSIRYKKLRPFGMLDVENLGSQTAYFKALLVNTAYDVLYNNHPWPKDMGDPTDEGFKYACQSWNQLMVNKKWSNYFFADTMYQKLRGAYADRTRLLIGGYNDDMYKRPSWQTEMEEAIANNLQAMAFAEHNRWNMEQLLMGYSPCQKADDDLLQTLVRDEQTEEQYQTKKALKLSAAKVHPNICDYEHLSLIDPNAKEYDIQLIYAIPRILMLVDGYGLCEYQS